MQVVCVLESKVCGGVCREYARKRELGNVETP
jgi:hypothetical protein